MINLINYRKISFFSSLLFIPSTFANPFLSYHIDVKSPAEIFINSEVNKKRDISQVEYRTIENIQKLNKIKKILMLTVDDIHNITKKNSPPPKPDFSVPPPLPSNCGGFAQPMCTN